MIACSLARERADHADHDLPALLHLALPRQVATYFASPACDVSVGQQHSVVLAQQQFCQLGDGGRSSYQVWCADDGVNGTLVSFADGSCSGAFATTPFLSNQCLAAGNGASAVSFQCRVDAMTAPPVLSCGRCQVSWFEVAGCTGNDRAIVDATAGLCQQDGSRSWMIGRDPNSGFARALRARALALARENTPRAAH